MKFVNVCCRMLELFKSFSKWTIFVYSYFFRSIQYGFQLIWIQQHCIPCSMHTACASERQCCGEFVKYALDQWLNKKVSLKMTQRSIILFKLTINKTTTKGHFASNVRFAFSTLHKKNIVWDVFNGDPFQYSTLTPTIFKYFRFFFKPKFEKPVWIFKNV